MEKVCTYVALSLCFATLCGTAGPPFCSLNSSTSKTILNHLGNREFLQRMFQMTSKIGHSAMEGVKRRSYSSFQTEQFNSGSRSQKPGCTSEMPKNSVSPGIGLSTLSLTIITSSLISDTVEGHQQVTMRNSLLLCCSF